MLSGVFLVGVSSALVWLGTAGKRRKEEAKERMSVEDAKLFPVIGSAVLLGLYYAIKFVPRHILDKILLAVFSITGVISVYRVLHLAMHDIRGRLRNEIKEAREAREATKNRAADASPSTGEEEETEETERKDRRAEAREGDKEPARSEASAPLGYWEEVVALVKGGKTMLGDIRREILQLDNFILFSISVLINSLYMKSRGYVTSNIIASCFAITGLRDIRPDSTRTVVVLLGLLFIYDVFWVFCTPVMVDVAKKIDLPIKITYPNEKSASLIGLGDIVIPGLYLGVAREFSDKNHARYVFLLGFIGYVLALILTFWIVVLFKAGQPALLYICPAVVLGSLGGAVLHGKTREFWGYGQE